MCGWRGWQAIWEVYPCQRELASGESWDTVFSYRESEDGDGAQEAVENGTATPNGRRDGDPNRPLLERGDSEYQ